MTIPEDRPIRASILCTHRLDTGEMVEAAQCQYQGGQIVGRGWISVRIDGGEWKPTEYRTQHRACYDLRQCATLEEVMVLIVNETERGERNA